MSLIESLSKHIRLTPEEIGIIESSFTSRRYRKKQYIMQEGDVTRHEVFITKGLVRTYQVDDRGQEHIIQFGFEGWWAGDLYSFLTETPSVYNVDCLEDTELLQIDKPHLEALYETVPKIERYFRILTQNAFIASTRRLSSTLAKPAYERYQDFINRYPELEQRVANHHIASFLGITPQSLSRIRSKSRN